MKSVFLLAFIFTILTISCLAQEKNPLFVIHVDEKQGYIDKTGKIVIQPQFERSGYAVSGDFSEGLAAVVINGKWGYIDKTGKVVIKPQFSMAGEFSEGMARIEVESGDSEYGLLGYINKNGRIVIKPQFKNVRLKMPNWGKFSEDLAVVEINEKMGFINKAGKIVIEPKYDWAVSFENGIAAVTIDGKHGFIDKSARLVIPAIYENANLTTFSEGLAQVKLDGKYFFIDSSGKKVLQPSNDYESGLFRFDFSEGLVSWQFGSGKWGYLDKNGETIIPALFDMAWEFSEGLAAVKVDGKWGYIDKTGTIVIEPQPFEMVGEFKNGLAEIENDDGPGYMDKTGKIVWMPSE
jgi:hypothetical protein